MPPFHQLCVPQEAHTAAFILLVEIPANWGMITSNSQSAGKDLTHVMIPLLITCKEMWPTISKDILIHASLFMIPKPLALQSSNLHLSWDVAHFALPTKACHALHCKIPQQQMVKSKEEATCPCSFQTS